MEPRRLTLLHLSDIHFDDLSETTYDLNIPLRGHLQQDLLDLLERQDMGPVHAILVTGDIAFSGSVEQYQHAATWLTKLAELSGCEEHNIAVVPGNHDIDRSTIRSSQILEGMHEQIRGQEVQNINHVLMRIIRDPESDMLLRPMANYNDFAARYSCDISSSKPYWDQDLMLNDSSILRVRGLTSTLVSDDHDNDQEYKLVLGQFQVVFVPDPRVAYMTLSHHPLSWMKDGELLYPIVNNSVTIQLYGHKHDQHVQQIDQSLILSAGALHPDRREAGWEPRYNVLQVWVTHESNGRKLNVAVFARRWSQKDGCYVPDIPRYGNEARLYQLDLPRWEQEPAVKLSLEDANEAISTDLLPARDIEAGVTESEDTIVSSGQSLRRIVYHYFVLPFAQSLAIAERLDLVDDTDRLLSGTALLSKIIERASERNLLDELAEEIAKAERL